MAASQMGTSKTLEACNPEFTKRATESTHFFLLSSLLIFVAIFFSRSRMGIFSATAAVSVVGGLWITSSARRRAAWIALAGFLAAAALAGIWIGLGPVAERYATVARDYQIRLEIWRDTLSLIRAHPLFELDGVPSQMCILPSKPRS
jgi:O-antigen ligase